MRNVVIEHGVVTRDTKEYLPPSIHDGIHWGQDFEELADPNPETPSTFWNDEGFNKKANQWVTYYQTFLRTEKTDEQLLNEYD
jgi:hypothetical protein